MIYNRKFSLIYRISAFLLGLIGVLLNISAFTSKFNPISFLFYTTQSNILVLLFLSILIIKTFRDKKSNGNVGSSSYYPRLQMYLVIAILLTMVVYWLMLAPGMDGSSGYSNTELGNLLVHLITPILFTVDYFMFSKNKALKKIDTLLVLIYPMFYLIYNSVLGLNKIINFAFGPAQEPTYYPYFFFDYDKVGLFSIVYITILIAFFVLLSIGFYLISTNKKRKVVYIDIRKEADNA